MRFKLDENLPLELLADRRAAGHEADGLRDEGLIRAPDDVVLDLVRRERRVLLTLDKGIADVRAYPPQTHAGIVLFRPPAAGRSTTLRFVRRHLASLFERELTGRLLVITDRGLRLRSGRGRRPPGVADRCPPRRQETAPGSPESSLRENRQLSRRRLTVMIGLLECPPRRRPAEHARAGREDLVRAPCARRTPTGRSATPRRSGRPHTPRGRSELLRRRVAELAQQRLEVL